MKRQRKHQFISKKYQAGPRGRVWDNRNCRITVKYGKSLPSHRAPQLWRPQEPSAGTSPHLWRGQPLQGQPLQLLTWFRRAIYSVWMFSNIVRFYSFNCSSTRRARLDSMSLKMPLPLCPDLESSSSGTNLSEQSFEVFLSCASSSILEFGVLNLICTWFFICWVGGG